MSVTRFAEAYLMMAKKLPYRPGAPGDGFRGHIDLTEKQLADPVRLQQEALSYGQQFRKEEDDGHF